MLEVITLTTAGAARLAASLKLSTGVPASPPMGLAATGAVMTVAGWWARQGIDCIHCGLSVVTTNNAATSTVTACEKIIQSLRIEPTDSKKGPP